MSSRKKGRKKGWEKEADWEIAQSQKIIKIFYFCYYILFLIFNFWKKIIFFIICLHLKNTMPVCISQQPCKVGRTWEIKLFANVYTNVWKRFRDRFVPLIVNNSNIKSLMWLLKIIFSKCGYASILQIPNDVLYDKCNAITQNV